MAASGNNFMSVEIRQSHEVEKLYRALKSIGDGKTLPRAFRKTLRQAALPALRDAKTAARGIYTSGRRHSGLRARIARATTTQVKLTGDPLVRIRISRKTMGNQSTLPTWINRDGVVLHPLFDRASGLTLQEFPGSRDWFDSAMRRNGVQVRAAVQRTLDHYARELTGG